jgi:hypothetical protein
MIDYDGIAKNVPFQIDCYLTTETGRHKEE